MKRQLATLKARRKRGASWVGNQVRVDEQGLSKVESRAERGRGPAIDEQTTTPPTEPEQPKKRGPGRPKKARPPTGEASSSGSTPQPREASQECVPGQAEYDTSRSVQAAQNTHLSPAKHVLPVQRSQAAGATCSVPRTSHQGDQHSTTVFNPHPEISPSPTVAIGQRSTLRPIPSKQPPRSGLFGDPLPRASSPSSGVPKKRKRTKASSSVDNQRNSVAADQYVSGRNTGMAGSRLDASFPDQQSRIQSQNSIKQYLVPSGSMSPFPGLRSSSHMPPESSSQFMPAPPAPSLARKADKAVASKSRSPLDSLAKSTLHHRPVINARDLVNRENLYLFHERFPVEEEWFSDKENEDFYTFIARASDDPEMMQWEVTSADPSQKDPFRRHASLQSHTYYHDSFKQSLSQSGYWTPSDSSNTSQ